MEFFLVKSLSAFFSKVRFKGSYRLARLLYPVHKTKWQQGVLIQKAYLSPLYKIRINLASKDLIDHKILFTGTYEPETNWALEKHLKEGDIVLEAGANSGTETLLISRLIGDSGKVLAFEPVPHVLEKLKNNLRLNAIRNVEVMPIALGAKEQEIDFFVHPLNHPNQGMGSKSINSALEKIVVTQKTIDSLFEENRITKFDFLKMDVQGAELDILKGARVSITRFRPKIFLEASEGWSNVSEIYSYLKGLNYNVLYLNPSCKLEEMQPPNLIVGNWLVLPIVNV